jgi:hypothetical protein
VFSVRPLSNASQRQLPNEKGIGMTRLHMHVVVESLPEAINFYSNLFDSQPCCGGKRYASWRIDEPPLNLAASVTDRLKGFAHFGLEVDSGKELPAVDRVLRGSLHEAGRLGKYLSEIKRRKRSMTYEASARARRRQ